MDHLDRLWESKKLVPYTKIPDSLIGFLFSLLIRKNSFDTLLFYQIEPLKNGVTLILTSSIARNSSAPNAKRIFQIHRGILEGCTNRAQPSLPSLKNCQNGTFWSVHGIWKFFGPNDFIWGAIKVPFFDFIQKMSQAPSSSVQVLILEDELDYLKNPSQDFKNSFCLWFLWIFSNAGRQI